MDDRIFELYREAIRSLNDKEIKIFALGFDLGIAEGTFKCTDKLTGMNKKRKN